MLIPYQVDVPIYRWPITNFIIIGVTLVVFILQLATNVIDYDTWVLKSWSFGGLFGHMWLHSGFVHFIGNMLFLWLFGNAVCAKIGNVAFAPFYILLGLVAGMAHILFSDGGAIGASGAINGVVGAFLVLYPLNAVSCAFLFFVVGVRTFEVKAYWIILLWLAFDIYGAASGDGGVGYYAHLGGFAVGFASMVIAIKAKWLVMDPGEKSLLQMLGIDGQKAEPVLQPRQRNIRRQPTPAATTPPPVPAMTQQTTAEMLNFKCVCGKALCAPRAQCGQVFMCPGCGKKLKLPEPRANSAHQ